MASETKFVMAKKLRSLIIGISVLVRCLGYILWMVNWIKTQDVMSRDEN